MGVRCSGGHPNVGAGSLLYEEQLLPAPFAPRALLGRGPLSARERAQFVGALAAAATARPARLGAQTCRTWVSEHSSTPLVSGLLAGLLRVASYCGDLGALSAGIGVAALGEATRRPVRYIDGGWQTIVSALAEEASAHGAELQPGGRVQELLVDGAAAGVRLSDGSEHRARAVVLAGLPPARVARLLGEADGCMAAVGQPRPIRAACLDVALSELPRPGCPFVLGLDQPLYLSVHSLACKLAPSGGAVVHLLRYDDGSEVSAEAALAQLESLLDQAQPGWRAHVVHHRFAPGMVVVNDLPSPARGLRGRPAVDDTGLAGAFIAGDWVGPRGWLAGAALHSGSDAAAAAMGAPGLIRSDGGAHALAAPA